jgi:hypothetical protein
MFVGSSMPVQNADRILNCMPSRSVETDWRFQHALISRVLGAPRINLESIDLRESWWAIGDQGTTGSCVGWATADGLLRWHFVKACKLPMDQSLSVRYIWMAAKETDEFTSYPTTFIEQEGTSLKAALDIARKFGVARDSDMPFGSGKPYSGSMQTFYASAAQLRIASYFNLGKNMTDWRTWLATKGPVLIRIDVDATWENATATKGNLDIYRSNTVRGGHAVLLVGYTRDRFIVRNSWGTGWGDKGFGYASQAYAGAAFSEAYGVSV